MVAILICAAALQAAGAERIKVAAPGLNMVNVDPKLQGFYTEHLAQQLAFQGMKTITPSEVAAVLGMERQKRLAGCNDDRCTADATESLDVDGILLGNLTRLERSYQLDVRIVKAGDATTLGTASATADDADRIVNTFPIVAQQLAKQVSARLGRALAPDASVELVSAPSRVKRLSWVPLAVGGAAAIGGGFLLLQATGARDRLVQRREQPLTEAEAQAIRDRGRQQQTVAWAGFGVGVAGIAAAAGMYLFGGNETVRAGVALAPGGDGATFALTGELP